ncbi:hypothetical protein M422DRAFT_266624 [Sphaerobolus stellatus SS14]|uniref:Myb-like domain-containing protein n=1 Tax=Sphaerobolus stellatus (strain SS14) TaxID=990650 RepID=A0A0C9URA7_SPHS4|nr:hypothetical protein M422DRAFT_266624 [Sphaerobolus stellatus SS14]
MPSITHSQAQTAQTEGSQGSPQWECEEGSLPSDSNSSSEHEQDELSSTRMSPVVQDHLRGVQLEPKQSRNAKSPCWQAWQDQYLASEVLKHCPFLEPQNATQEAWDRLSDELHTDSKKVGHTSEIRRTGAACHAQFYKILDAHRKQETFSLQATGTNEQMDEHVQVLTDLLALVDEAESNHIERSRKAKKKTNIENTAALELRNAAMNHLVDSHQLTDITQLEGATVREKQGQRK